MPGSRRQRQHNGRSSRHLKAATTSFQKPPRKPVLSCFPACAGTATSRKFSGFLKKIPTQINQLLLQLPAATLLGPAHANACRVQLDRLFAKTDGTAPSESTMRTGVPGVAHSNSFIAGKIGRLMQPCEQYPPTMSPAWIQTVS